MQLIRKSTFCFWKELKTSLRNKFNMLSLKKALMPIGITGWLIIFAISIFLIYLIFVAMHNAWF